MKQMFAEGIRHFSVVIILHWKNLRDTHQEWLCSNPTLCNTLSPFISDGDCSIIQLLLQTCLTCTSQAEKTILQQTIFFPLKNQKPVLMIHLYCLGNVIHADKSTTVLKIFFPVP